MIGLADIPKPVRADPERLMAFRDILLDLFDKHPCSVATLPHEAQVYYSLADVRRYREKAFASLGNVDVIGAAYYACDTGAPNEEILSAYTLLFT